MKYLLLLTVLLASGVALSGDIMQPVSVVVSAPIAQSETPTNYYKNVNISTTAVNVKVGQTELRGYYFYNNAVAGNERYVKFFNRSTAPTPGVTIADLTIPIGGRSDAAYIFPRTVIFSNGLWIFATTGSGDTATGAPANGEVLGNIFYK